MRRALFIVGWALLGALIWAVIFGTYVFMSTDETEDFMEQATFRTEKVEAVAGGALKAGHCTESKRDNGTTQTHGTSYEVDVTWTGLDGEPRTGEMSTCNPPDAGQRQFARRGLQSIAAGPG